MTVIATAYPSLAARLGPTRGKLIENASLAPFTWFRVGGSAQALFIPDDLEALCEFLAATDPSVPVTTLGAASNVIVRDGGVPGVVLRLGPSFGRIAIDGGLVKAGAAALDKKVALSAADAGVAGLEFLSGVPGAIGGAVRMNAGCYGAETKDALASARAVDRSGRIFVAPPADLGHSYRTSLAPADWIFVEATFEGRADQPAAIHARIDAIRAKREESQPIREKTGGSTFKNPDPPGTPDQRRAWALIDAAGGRGLRVGGAQMSDKHCNFMINAGDATAADLEALGEEVRRRVRETSGVDLHWEIKRLGVTPEEAARLSA